MPWVTEVSKELHLLVDGVLLVGLDLLTRVANIFMVIVGLVLIAAQIGLALSKEMRVTLTLSCA